MKLEYTHAQLFTFKFLNMKMIQNSVPILTLSGHEQFGTHQRLPAWQKVLIKQGCSRCLLWWPFAIYPGQQWCFLQHVIANVVRLHHTKEQVPVKRGGPTGPSPHGCHLTHTQLPCPVAVLNAFFHFFKRNTGKKAAKNPGFVFTMLVE